MEIGYLRMPDTPAVELAVLAPTSIQVGDTVVIGDESFVCVGRVWRYLPPPEYQSPFGPVGASWMLDVVLLAARGES